MVQRCNTDMQALARDLEQQLFERFGPLVGRSDLTKVLGYKTEVAFRQAVARGTVPVRVFPIPGRKGKWALVKCIATWLASVHAEGKK